MTRVFISTVLLVSIWCQTSSFAIEQPLKASFSLNASKVITGVKVPDDFEAKNVYAELTNELFNGKTNAIAIYFYKGEIKEPRKDYDVVMVLFIDKNNKIWQVNMTYVIPGFSTANTVAGSLKELEQFSDYSFDGINLHLKSKGSYSRKEATQSIDLDWDIDAALPVTNRIKQ
jgi:hypothetical protein